MTAEPDISATAVLLNSKPTAVFAAKPYHRTVTSVVVGNGVYGPVTAYRGLIGGRPVAQNAVGDNNTLRGPIPLPAGQQLFIVWENAPTDLTTAFARLSAERDDNPLGDNVGGAAPYWDTASVTSLTLPTGADPNVGPVIFLNGLRALIQAIGASGVMIRLDASQNFPTLRWYSEDGSVQGGLISINDQPNFCDMQYYAGDQLCADNVQRFTRLLLRDSLEYAEFAWILTSDGNSRSGGFVEIKPALASLGYEDDTQIPNIVNQLNISATQLDTNLPLLVTGETWHAVALSNGWLSGSGSGSANAGLRAQLVASPPSAFWLQGRCHGGTTASGTIVGNLPDGYRPALNLQIPVCSDGNGSIVIAEVRTTGDIVTVGAGWSNDVSFNSLIPLN